ncbi:MAG: class I SAM-dependent methyltransferase [Betaproteobacteria bacterium]|nr:class I SAM-dependent methyltransferase [Betaproteobacteria bacterium]
MVALYDIPATRTTRHCEPGFAVVSSNCPRGSPTWSNARSRRIYWRAFPAAVLWRDLGRALASLSVRGSACRRVRRARRRLRGGLWRGTARAARNRHRADIDGPTIAAARAKYAMPALRFEAGSVTAMPFADASFDCVVSFETLEHLAEQQAMLVEMRRVLRPQGVLIISTPNRVEYSDKRASITSSMCANCPRTNSVRC